MSIDIQALTTESLRQIAPDIEIAAIDRQMDLRDAFDIDSMDFLNLVSRLSKGLNIDIPEKDYPSMVTSFESLLTYLKARTE